jgi:hypothetical protein
VSLALLCLLLFQDEYDSLLERLRGENAGEYQKVKQLDRETALRFLREKYGKDSPTKKPDNPKPGQPDKPKTGQPDKPKTGQPDNRKTEQPDNRKTEQPDNRKTGQPAPPRLEQFTKMDTLRVGDFSIDLCRRDDGAFGLGEIRRGDRPLRRADFLIAWKIDGKVPVFAGRKELTITLRNPDATLAFAPETRAVAGTTLAGFRMTLRTARGPIVETASWEPGGSTRGLTYFDGYRGWHAPPAFQPADGVDETNPKLMPGLLSGAGFQFLHGPGGALALFHTAAGDRLKNVSRGEALEFETTFAGPTTIDRFVMTLDGDRPINLWTRAFEAAHAEIRKALGLGARGREIVLLWPTFDRKGFRETAREAAEATAREGFTAAAIDVIWDNYEQHGGAKNMNVWDYAVSEGYGGADGLRALVDECHRRGLKVIPWCPAGHLVDVSPVWKQHPDWLAGSTPSTGKDGHGPVYGSLHTGFRDYYGRRVLSVIREFKLDGLWMDSHLPYPAQPRDNPHADKLARLYVEFIKAGAAQLIVEGDASAIGAYGIGIDESWGDIPEPDLFYDSMMLGWGNDPALYTRHFRKYVAAGAAWVVAWDTLTSGKLTGPEWDAARREIRAVVRDYARVKDLMVHRFIGDDGVTWTNDRDRTKVVWLLRDATLPDGRPGKAGEVHVVR